MKWMKGFDLRKKSLKDLFSFCTFHYDFYAEFRFRVSLWTFNKITQNSKNVFRKLKWVKLKNVLEKGEKRTLKL